MKDDVISRHGVSAWLDNVGHPELADVVMDENRFPSAQPERLTDDDFETIRIHLSAFKESLCNQRRWKEAKDYERLISRFMSFASTQSEKRTDEHTETHACDLIDRAEAIDALRTHERKPSKKWFDNQLDIEWNNAIDICCYDIEDLPSAQPERKRGKWIDYTEDGYVECPFCHSATNCDGNKDELHFCFSCGADMREDDHEIAR